MGQGEAEWELESRGRGGKHLASQGQALTLSRPLTLGQPRTGSDPWSAEGRAENPSKVEGAAEKPLASQGPALTLSRPLSLGQQRAVSAGALTLGQRRAGSAGALTLARGSGGNPWTVAGGAENPWPAKGCPIGRKPLGCNLMRCSTDGFDVVSGTRHGMIVAKNGGILSLAA